MEKLINIETSKDIIASSPWVIADGLKPHRIVIRNLQDEYVVHDEVLSENKGSSIGSILTYFIQGFYTKDIKKAFEDFSERADRTLSREVIGKVEYIN